MTMHGLKISRPHVFHPSLVVGTQDGLSHIHASWQECVVRGLSKVDQAYLAQLSQSKDWLPGNKNIFNAFSLPLSKVNYVLFGESPYPRTESANGFAFWDAAVKNIWSDKGMSTRVNRATSLRNLIKMLLIAEGKLSKQDTSQASILKIDKTHLIQTCDDLFQNFLQHGFLLLNATPVLKKHGSPQKDARQWEPFIQEVLLCLLEKKPDVKFLLWGKVANKIDRLITLDAQEKLYAEHPYNLSFITNEAVISFFRPLRLLMKKS